MIRSVSIGSALLILLTGWCDPASSQSQREADFGFFTVEYTTENGRLHGPYTSHYKNGQKRAQGKFEHNQRSGTWTLWDREGDTITQRVYESPYAFKRTVPPIPEDGPFERLSQPVYEPERNDEGSIERFYLEERAVVWEHRVFREIKKENNGTLFEEDLLLVSMYRAFRSDTSVHIYHNGNFTEEDGSPYMDPDSVPELEGIDEYWFRTNEIWFFDNDRLIMDKKIIGIAPVIAEGKDTTELFWMYYPGLREHLAKVELPEQPFEKVQVLEDHFFYWQYEGTAYKAGPKFDKRVHPEVYFAYARASKKEEMDSSEIEGVLSLLHNDIYLHEVEHEAWMYFVGE